MKPNITKSALISLISLIFLVSLISFCCTGASTDFSGSWKKPGYTGQKFNNILVVAISNDIIKRSNVEDAVVRQLRDNKINAGSSIKVLDYSKLQQDNAHLDSTKREETKSQLKSLGYDGVITVSLLDIKEKTEYVPGTSYYTPGFYSYWYGTYTYVNNPGYYVNKTSVYLETRLYDLGTEDLLWAGQPVTENPTDIKEFAASFSASIVPKMISNKAILR